MYLADFSTVNKEQREQTILHWHSDTISAECEAGINNRKASSAAEIIVDVATAQDEH